MSLRHKLSSALLGAALAFGAAVFPAQLSSPAYAQTTEIQSALGRITSVQGNTFTLDASKQQRSAKDDGTAKNNKTLTVTVDQDTSVHGKIAVGADANVTYRTEDGNNIAVSVRIRSAVLVVLKHPEFLVQPGSVRQMYDAQRRSVQR